MKKVFKQFTSTVSQIGERQASFMISTSAIDRDGDTIDPKGWDLTAFKENPVVLWAHDYSQPPIGRAINIAATEHGLRADVEFTPKGMHPFADMVYDMIQAGFLNATSVGFRGKGEKAQNRERGYDFTSQELLEFSIVPVPSNPEALALRGETNQQLHRYARAMRHWTKAILGEDAPKLDAEQFTNLADAIAKAMTEQPKEQPKDEPSGLDYAAIAAEVAKLLGNQKVVVTLDSKEIAYGLLKDGVLSITPQEISKDILDIVPTETEIDWSGITFTEPEITQRDIQGVADMLMKEMQQTFREMVGAEARTAINHMTGRLD